MQGDGVTLLLTERDVAALLDMRTLIDALEDALRRPFDMPPKVYIHVEEHEGDFRAMPCRQGDLASLKWVSVHPRNPARGLPTVRALLVLSDARDATPLALMPATWLTAMRTGAMSGVATRYLARSDASTLAIVGAGVQAGPQAHAVACVRRLKETRIYDVRIEAAQRCASELESALGCAAVVCNSCEAAVRGADIVCTCTPSRRPIVASAWVGEGVHINAIGADAEGKQELEPALLRRAKVVVDDIEQAVHGGEPNVAIARGLYSRDEIAATIADVVKGARVRVSDRDVTLFCSTGLALQDLAAARLIYEAARSRGIGTHIELC